jgi:hypothetical protein
LTHESHGNPTEPPLSRDWIGTAALLGNSLPQDAMHLLSPMALDLIFQYTSAYNTLKLPSSPERRDLSLPRPGNSGLLPLVNSISLPSGAIVTHYVFGSKSHHVDHLHSRRGKRCRCMFLLWIHHIPVTYALYLHVVARRRWIPLPPLRDSIANHHTGRQTISLH